MKNIKSWFTGLSRFGQITVIAVIAIIFLGGVMTVSALSSPPGDNKDTPEKTTTEEKKPVTTTKTEVKTEEIPFEKETVESAALAKGKTEIQTVGVNGVKTITYTITLVDGIETNRTSAEVITKNPVNEVTVVGTYVEPAPEPVSSCNENYSGCVPIDSDVDCAGGSGNGPSYVSGPIQVIGYDIYGLDRDGDGWGCE